MLENRAERDICDLDNFSNFILRFNQKHANFCTVRGSVGLFKSVLTFCCQTIRECAGSICSNLWLNLIEMFMNWEDLQPQRILTAVFFSFFIVLRIFTHQASCFKVQLMGPKNAQWPLFLFRQNSIWIFFSCGLRSIMKNPFGLYICKKSCYPLLRLFSNSKA